MAEDLLTRYARLRRPRPRENVSRLAVLALSLHVPLIALVSVH